VNSACVDLPDISSSSFMRSLSISGGSLLEKKSFKAVATAFTGISKECISTLPSMGYKRDPYYLLDEIYVENKLEENNDNNN